MERIFIFLGSVAAMLGVGIGAFGAHGLKGRLSSELLHAFQTGVAYHLPHALGLVLIGLIFQGVSKSPLVAAAGWLLLCGIILFSGSLYLMAVTGIGGLGLVTPFGGMAFILGWTCLAIGVLRDRH